MVSIRYRVLSIGYRVLSIRYKVKSIIFHENSICLMLNTLYKILNTLYYPVIITKYRRYYTFFYINDTTRFFVYNRARGRRMQEQKQIGVLWNVRVVQILLYQQM